METKNNTIQEIIEELYNQNINFIKENKEITGKLSILYPENMDYPSKMYKTTIEKNFKKYLHNVNISLISVTNKNVIQKIIEEKDTNGMLIINSANYDDEVFSSIPQKIDLDKLSSRYLITKNPEELPVTAFGIFKILEKIRNNDENFIVTLIGNGLTVNSHLNAFLLKHKKYSPFLISSAMPLEHDVATKVIIFSDVIISATGKAEILRGYRFFNKKIISPTIVEKKGIFYSDVSQSIYNIVDTNKVLGGIGKLTNSELLVRFINLVKH